MKTRIVASLGALVAAYGLAMPASAALVIDVLTLDSLVCQGKLDTPTLTDETAFIQSAGCLNSTDYVLTGKYESLGEGAVFEMVTDDGFSDSYAVRFDSLTCSEGSCGTSPDYYLIKIGTGGLAASVNDVYLFENEDSMLWAYFRLSQLCTGCDIDIGRLSHISVGAGTPQVPEPATLGLLGLGLAGLGFASRRRRKA